MQISCNWNVTLETGLLLLSSTSALVEMPMLHDIPTLLRTAHPSVSYYLRCTVQNMTRSCIVPQFASIKKYAAHLNILLPKL